MDCSFLGCRLIRRLFTGDPKYLRLQIYSLGLFSSLERNTTNLCLWRLSLVICILEVKSGKKARESHGCRADVYLICLVSCVEYNFCPQLGRVQPL